MTKPPAKPKLPAGAPEIDAVEPGDEIELDECRATGLQLADARLTELTVLDSVLVRCDLSNAQSRTTVLRRTELHDCRLTGASLAEAEIRDVVFRDCRADLASLRFVRGERLLVAGCNLGELDLVGAKLTHVRFEHCDLRHADLSGATLTECAFVGCELDGLRGAEALRGSAFPRAEIVANAELWAGALGLTTLDDD